MSLSGGLYVYEDTHGSIQVLCQFFNENVPSAYAFCNLLVFFHIKKKFTHTDEYGLVHLF